MHSSSPPHPSLTLQTPLLPLLLSTLHFSFWRFRQQLKSDHRTSCAGVKISGDVTVLGSEEVSLGCGTLGERSGGAAVANISRGQCESSWSWEAFSDSASSGLGVPPPSLLRASFLVPAAIPLPVSCMTFLWHCELLDAADYTLSSTVSPARSPSLGGQ